MRRVLCIVIAVVAPVLSAGAQLLSHKLDEVTITAKRPLSEVGVQKVSIDSTALRENIALSMADVIGFNSSLFVKTSGRATLSTVSFRGASSSHTNVNWNGIPINSPALGMTDFSLIPGYFIDRADLLHGSSSLSKSSGALGGLVDLRTSPADIADGFNLQYVQGAGSFTTFDEFLRATYGTEKWKLSTRAVYSSSKNDFSFINRDKKENIYDDNHNIISSYHPKEKNRNGAYNDFHILQQAYFTPTTNDNIGLDVWYTLSDREIPLTTVDYMTSRAYINKQNENTLRSVLSYKHIGSGYRTEFKTGYVYTSLAYDYGFSLSDQVMQMLTLSRSYVNTAFLNGNIDWHKSDKIFFNTEVSVTHNRIKTVDHAHVGSYLGFKKIRTDADLAFSTRWQATEDLGLRAVVREEMVGGKLQQPVPALFADYVIYSPADLRLKASVSRNLHKPTLNDLYFVPGGNPDLKSETGFTYDFGAAFSTVFGAVAVSASANWFDSYINDWILWLPTNKGFFSPRNLKKVHSHGIEIEASAGMKPFEKAYLDFSGSFAWTSSINETKPQSEFDRSSGRQLPYVPKFSSSATVTFSWKEWSLIYKLCHYSRRFTQSSNETSLSGYLPAYLMNTATIERRFNFRPANLSLKLAVNNLFDAEYQTIMSHPMPGINFEFFLSITPKF